jgi:hypothetical protein
MGYFPKVTILNVVPGRVVSPAQLEGMGLVAAPSRASIVSLRVSRGHENAIRERRWPDYQRCLERAPPNHGKSGRDNSRADFVGCMTALDWGYSTETAITSRRC